MSNIVHAPVWIWLLNVLLAFSIGVWIGRKAKGESND